MNFVRNEESRLWAGFPGTEVSSANAGRGRREEWQSQPGAFPMLDFPDAELPIDARSVTTKR